MAVRQNWRIRKTTTNVTILVRSPEGTTMYRQDRLSSFGLIQLQIQQI